MWVPNCAYSAFMLHGFSRLKATQLTIRASTSSGAMMLFGSSSVDLTDCHIDGTHGDGICMHENTRLVGTRLSIRKVKHRGMILNSTSDAFLTSSIIHGRSIWAGVLRDEASIELASCLVGIGFLKQGTRTTEITHCKFGVTPVEPAAVDCFGWLYHPSTRE